MERGQLKIRRVNLVEDTNKQFQKIAGGEAGAHYSGLNGQMDGEESTSSCCLCREKNTVGTSDRKSGRLLLLIGVIFKMEGSECFGQYAPCF